MLRYFSVLKLLEPPPTDVCRYRLDPGPCNETGIMKVYWDAESGRCQPFAYGGCQGGPNRFSSEDECEEVCGPTGPGMYRLWNKLSISSPVTSVVIRYFTYY